MKSSFVNWNIFINFFWYLIKKPSFLRCLEYPLKPFHGKKEQLNSLETHYAKLNNQNIIWLHSFHNLSLPPWLSGKSLPILPDNISFHIKSYGWLHARICPHDKEDNAHYVLMCIIWLSTNVHPYAEHKRWGAGRQGSTHQCDDWIPAALKSYKA